FAYGAAAAEVEVDGFTGAYRLRRADIAHDVGDSLSPLVDLGQIEGGFVQGVGWLTLEELLWDETDGKNRGRLNTQAASTYKIPSFSEMPPVFNVYLFERATESGVVYGSKAVGEPPLMEAFSMRDALRQAVAALRPPGGRVYLGRPSAPQAVFGAVHAARDPAGGTSASGAAEQETHEAKLNPYARNEHGRQGCGGVVRLLLEPLPARPAVALFGLGHVGYELARILSRLPVRLVLVDSRPEQ